jgi:hypothetical protein
MTRPLTSTEKQARRDARLANEPLPPRERRPRGRPKHECVVTSVGPAEAPPRYRDPRPSVLAPVEPAELAAYQAEAVTQKMALMIASTRLLRALHLEALKELRRIKRAANGQKESAEKPT